MKSLLNKLQVDREDYTDKGWDKYLKQLLEDLKNYNYYEMLGVSPENLNDLLSDLRKNFKEISLMIHPDKASGKVYQDSTSEIIKLVNAAYDVLKDPYKEITYRTQQYTSSKNYNSFNSNNDGGFNEFGECDPFNDSKGFSGVFNSYNTNSFNTTSNFGNSSFTHTQANKVIHGDVNAGDLIESFNEDIVIEGNVYGAVKSIKGDIRVRGFVAGTGAVSNFKGNITVEKGIKMGGSVYNVYGTNEMWGGNLGSCIAVNGDNLIDINHGLNFRKSSRFF